jgi:hypothetical protein
MALYWFSTARRPMLPEVIRCRSWGSPRVMLTSCAPAVFSAGEASVVSVPDMSVPSNSRTTRSVIRSWALSWARPRLVGAARYSIASRRSMASWVCTAPAGSAVTFLTVLAFCRLTAAFTVIVAA